MRRIAVIGGGAWGTALALVAARTGTSVVLWARDPAIADAINRDHENPVYLPAIALDRAIAATTEAETALVGAEAALLVVPAQFMRGVLDRLKPLLPSGMPLLLAAKGIDIETLRTMSELAGDLVPDCPVAVLSGPSFAGEVARDLPTAVTI
ncbi:MAG: NAD(P)-binding domain-containing protein, partial [Alphaproteobacteria bacterium]|nr:NAD(P)-binding domain-containing protein [Alphaproteobacteria bacterium]